MKDVGNVTRVVPDRRVDALMKFRKRIADNPDVFSHIYFTLYKVNFYTKLNSSRFNGI